MDGQNLFINDSVSYSKRAVSQTNMRRPNLIISSFEILLFYDPCHAIHLIVMELYHVHA